MISTSLIRGERLVTIPAGAASLPGVLAWPNHPSGMVLFAHGSGSGRRSPRNEAVARQLRDAGVGTLLLDLLTEAEARDRHNVFDIDLLADRLLLATEWLVRQPEAAGLALGYFGASTGAAASLEAAARSRTPIEAVVSRGGRPDLAVSISRPGHCADPAPRRGAGPGCPGAQPPGLPPTELHQAAGRDPPGRPPVRGAWDAPGSGGVGLRVVRAPSRHGAHLAGRSRAGRQGGLLSPGDERSFIVLSEWIRSDDCMVMVSPSKEAIR